MNDAPAPTTEAPAAEAPAAEAKTSLDDFCSTLSLSDRRVEMIGAFHHVESKAGRKRDLPSAFADRYKAFLTAPA